MWKREKAIVVWETKSGIVWTRECQSGQEAKQIAVKMRQHPAVLYASPIRSTAEIAEAKRIEKQLKVVRPLNR